MSKTVDSDPEWSRMFAIFDAISGFEARRVISVTYYNLISRNSKPSDAMRQALQQHGVLPRPMVDGADEYEEIMKGAGIWASIQSG